MNKAKKQKLAEELIKKLNRMSIPILYGEVSKLDDERKHNVINALSPEKFQLMVQYEMKQKETATNLWEQTGSIKKELLDALSPVQLAYIGGKHSSRHLGWGQWKDLRYNKDQQHVPCNRLVDYFLVCSPQRASKVLLFFIRSTKGVTAPADERDRNIFKYAEGKQFPFEVISLLSTMHPKVLFPALNTVSPESLKKVFWLSEKMCSDSDSIENVLLDSYSRNSNIYYEELEEIAKAAPLLGDTPLCLLLRKTDEATQRLITKTVGRERLVEMKTKGYSFTDIAVDSSIRLAADKIPNETVLKDLSTGKRNIRQLSPTKVLELAGEILS
ncbi:MAG: hypothetical protein KBB91_00835 [Candidatus Pacebacteria bacterium]|nr:hypothetical protein [Candidatus Paceibacterota bacterium]MBP9700952.1 hypothetical protein [Candidatus Paceibacterota bacterium]